jgi:hypothetical protein
MPWLMRLCGYETCALAVNATTIGATKSHHDNTSPNQINIKTGITSGQKITNATNA